MLAGMDETPAQAFSKRLIDICADQRVDGRGQQTRLAEKFGVVPNAARKWLLGLGMPEMEMAVRIANWGGVNVTWLLQGTGPKTGAAISMMSIVIDDALHAMPFEASREVLNFMRFKMQTTFGGSDPRLHRYETAIAAVIETLRTKPAAERQAVDQSDVNRAGQVVETATLTSLTTVPPAPSTGKIGGKAPTVPSANGKRRQNV